MDEKEKELYSKGEGARDLRPKKEDSKPTTITSEGTSIPLIVGYNKEEGTIIPSLFIIISGGVKREKQYFEIYNKKDYNLNQKFPRIQVKFVSKDGKGLQPKQMLEEALKLKNSTTTTHEKDRFYLVTDVDEFRDDLIMIKSKCRAENLRLVISNYCFEVWLYYGKHDTRPTLNQTKKYITPTNTSQCSKEFKRYLNELGSVGSEKAAIYDIENAIKNAQRNYSEDLYGIPTRFSTNMFKLAKEILAILGDDLEIYREEEEKKKQEAIKKQQNTKNNI